MIIYNNWGTIEYAQAWDKQKELFEARVNAKNYKYSEIQQNSKNLLNPNNQQSSNNHPSNNNQPLTEINSSSDNQQSPLDDIVIFCEHPHVYTLGKSGVVENLLISNQNLIEQGVSFFKTDRGGDITYHGPGQIVGYPIFDLEHFNIGLKQYIFKLEEAVIRFLRNYGINGERLPGSTGVWLDVDLTETPEKPDIQPYIEIPTNPHALANPDIQAKPKTPPNSTIPPNSAIPPNTGSPASPRNTRKICAIGVKSSRFITMHGLALNINTDLKYFNYINPCGFVDKGVTSLHKETGIEHSMETCREQLLKEILEVFKT